MEQVFVIFRSGFFGNHFGVVRDNIGNPLHAADEKIRWVAELIGEGAGFLRLVRLNSPALHQQPTVEGIHVDDIDAMITGEGFGRDAIAGSFIVAANAFHFDGRVFGLKRLIQFLPAFRLPRYVGHDCRFLFRRWTNNNAAKRIAEVRGETGLFIASPGQDDDKNHDGVKSTGGCSRSQPVEGFSVIVENFARHRL